MIYCDTEYNDRKVLLWFSQKNKEEAIGYDLRTPEGVEDLKQYIEDNKDEVFASYAVHAEITAMLRLGIEVSQLKFLDIMAECRMITMSHHEYFSMDGGMLSQVRCLLGKDVKEDAAHKKKMIDLIIGQDSWTDSEWEEIVCYCYSDIADLRELYKKVIDIHMEEGHPYILEQVLARGEYIRMSAEMDYASKGFPVYGGAIMKLFKNRDKIKTSIVERLPVHWRICYQKKKGGGWTLKRNLIEELIRIRGWKQWRRTANGGPSLEADYLKELSIQIPEVHDLYEAVKSLTTLNSDDLSKQVVDDYIKPKTFAFTAVTGRNGLKPKQGYLLNLPKWMRKIINPHPGMYLAGYDYSQQEIAIAAALSGDAKLLEAYESGDIYLALGKLSGHIPQDGTKSTHKKQRDLFKALQLGLGYGKGVNSLGYDIWGIMRDDGMTLTDAKIKANEIFNWHKRTFSTYWAWNDKQIRLARNRGWIESIDGWTEWVSYKTKDTQLKNFPSQANGAVMLRIATKLIYEAWRKGEVPPLLCSQHDAVYFNILASIEPVVTEKILNLLKISAIKTIAIEVKVDPKLYGMGNEYTPEGFEKRHQELWEMSIESTGYSGLLM